MLSTPSSQVGIFKSVLPEAFAVLPGVHLLGNDVGFFAHAAGKQASVFENGRADFAEVVAGEDLAGGGLDAVPESRFRRQQVAGAAHGFEGGHDLSSLNVRFVECSARADQTLIPGNLRTNLAVRCGVPRFVVHSTKGFVRGEQTANRTPTGGIFRAVRTGEIPDGSCPDAVSLAHTFHDAPKGRNSTQTTGREGTPGEETQRTGLG